MSKCVYCAFYSHACTNPDWDTFAAGIISEIAHWGDILGRIDIPTIFFGGGTPSLMPVKTFDRIMNAIGDKFNLGHECEITLESNPGTLDETRLHDFVSAGVNRLSVGIQRLDDKDLKFLGRRHSVSDAMGLIGAAHNTGIRTSADFIYGLPGDTADTVAKMCRDINAMGLNHCSMYELTVEENTPLFEMRPKMPDNDAMAEMYCAISQNLNPRRYEVSNYATTTNDQCRHNVNIWDGAPYIGIGRGGAGRVYMNGQWYEQMGAGQLFKPMSTRDRAVEMVITGLRTARGVLITPDIVAVTDMPYADANPDLLARDGNRIGVTEKGLLILDKILVNFIR